MQQPVQFNEDGTPATTKPPPTWDEVIRMPEMRGLRNEQIEQARIQYFRDIVAPQVPTDQLHAARAAFDSDTAPGPLHRAARSLAETVAEVRTGAAADYVRAGIASIDQALKVPERTPGQRDPEVAPLDRSIGERVKGHMSRGLDRAAAEDAAWRDKREGVDLSQPVAVSVSRTKLGRELDRGVMGLRNTLDGMMLSDHGAVVEQIREEAQNQGVPPEQVQKIAATGVPVDYARAVKSYQELRDKMQQRQRQMELIPRSSAVRTMFEGEGAEGVDNFVNAFREDPGGATAVIIGASVPGSLAILATAALARFAGAGAATTATAGGAASTFVEFGNQYAQNRDNGMSHENAWNRAAIKAGTIGAFDAVSLRSAGKAVSEMTKGTAVKVWLKESGRQAALGAGGETYGSALSGKMPQPGEVAAEAVGEFVLGVPEGAIAMGRRREVLAVPPADRTPVPAADVLEQPKPEAVPIPVRKRVESAVGADSGVGDLFTQPAEAALAPTGEAAVAPAAPEFVRGFKTAFATERGAKLEGEFAVVEADGLVMSHDTALNVNKAYPAELQPRDRTRDASEVQVARIAQNLQPEFLGGSPQASQGAPIVGDDGIVESGNARGIALKRAYGEGKAGNYRDWVLANAEKFGIDPARLSQIKRPVLVRIRTTPVNRAEFSRQANESSVAQLSPLELARSDAARLKSLDDLAVGENGEIQTSANMGFIRRFVGLLPVTEQAALVTGTGELSQSGVTRMRNAILAKAYGGGDVLMRMVESPDDNIRNITSGLVRAAPRVAKAREEIAAGQLHNLDITEDLLKAVEWLSRLRADKRSVDQWLAQISFFEADASPEFKALMKFLDESSRSPRRIAEFIELYLASVDAAGSPSQVSMFGDQVPSKAAIIEQAKKGLTREPEQQRLAPVRERAPAAAGIVAGRAEARGAERGAAVSRPAEPEAQGGSEPTGAAVSEGGARKDEGAIAVPRPAVQAKKGIALETPKRSDAELERAGAEAFATGAKRMVPRDILVNEGNKGGTAWARGWDRANLAALVPEPKGAKQKPGAEPPKKPAAAAIEKAFGSENKIFTKERAAAARNLLRKKLGQVSAGLDPEMVQAGIELAGFYIEGGARKFAEYSAKMIADLGEAARPYLKSWYLAVRNYPGYNNTGMESEAQLEDEEIEDAGTIRGDEKLDDKARTAGAGGEATRRDQIQQDEEARRAAGDEIPRRGAGEEGAVLGDVDAAAHEAATSTKNEKQEPTEAQKEAGNYEKGHVTIGGLDISIENPEGSKRRPEWPTLKQHYGYFKGTVGFDKDHLDVFVKPGTSPEFDGTLFVVNQLKANGKFDEHKVMLGFDSEAEAREAYLENYTKGWEKRVQSIVPISLEDFKRWAFDMTKEGPKGGALSAGVETDAEKSAEARKPGAPTEVQTARLGREDEGETAAGSQLRVPDRAEAGDREPDTVAGPSGVADRGPLAAGVAPADTRPGEEGDAGRGAARPSKAGSGDLFGLDSGRPEQPSRAPRSDATVRHQPGASKPVTTDPADFTITDDDRIGEGGLKQKYRDNVAAIRLLKQIEAEDRRASPEEQKTLARYVGWGGLKGVFDSDNKEWEKQHDELRELLNDEEYEAARRTILDAHYTSVPVVRAIWSILERAGFTKGRVLEPSIGIGNFIGLMPPAVRADSSVFGAELDGITARLARQAYQRAEIVGPKGFEDVNIPEGYFDVAVGNPPFGNQQVFDKRNEDISKFSIHNFFFAKSLLSLRPGGILAMVVSRYLMDQRNSAARQWISDHAKLLGALRLPYTAFKGNANTEVITDVIVLQRLAEGEKSQIDWVNTKEIQVEGKDATVNLYYANHPEMMLGQLAFTGSMYRADELTLNPKPGETIEKALKAVLERFPEKVYEHPARRVEVMVDTAGLVPTTAMVGNYFVLPDGSIARRIDDVMEKRRFEKVEISSKAGVERLKGMIRIRNVLRGLMRRELEIAENDGTIMHSRRELNELYDSFVRKFGYLNALGNRRAFQDDHDIPLLESLEPDYDPGISKAVSLKRGVASRAPSAGKAAIFSRRVLSPYTKPTSAETPKDALVASLNEHGSVNLPYMAELLGQDEEAIPKELAGLVYMDPQSQQWQVSDQYLTGNVKQKLAAARAAVAGGDTRFKENVEALEKVQPADIPAVDISVRIGSPWVLPEYISDFTKAILGVGAAVNFTKSIGLWHFRPSGDVDRVANTSTWGTVRAPAVDLIADLLNMKAIVIKDNVGTSREPEYVVNQPETQAAQAKGLDLQRKFVEWLWDDTKRRDRLGRIYNDTFNTDRPRNFDGAHLQLPGANPSIQLRASQKNAIWRAVQDRTTLLDHVVGAGKTFTMAAIAMELRRLGIVRKPVFTVLNHLVTQWRDEFYRLYPNAQILAAREKDFEKTNRARLFSRIATGDWDAVIVGHSSFKKIGMPEQAQNDILGEMIADLAAAIETMKRERGDRHVVRDMEKIKANLESKVKNLAAKTGEKDKAVTFEDIGADALFVDEAHLFKNLFFTTRMQRVAGLGNPQGSGRAFDMFVKTQYLQKRFGGRAPVTFATGTPISNSLVEMFTMQRYLMYEELKARGIHLLDSWARVFGDVQSVYEVHPSGNGYRLADRFAKFVNMPELMTLYRRVADVVTMDDLKRQAREAGGRFPVPKVKGGKPTLHVSERSALQRQFFGVPEFIRDPDDRIVFEMNDEPSEYSVEKREAGKGPNDGKEQWAIMWGGNVHQGGFDTEAEARAALEDGLRTPKLAYNEDSILWKFEHLRELTRSTKGKVNALSITNDARKAGLDFRLIDPNAADFSGSKLNDMVKEVVRIYKNWGQDRGTQLIFSDLSVPASAREKVFRQAKEAAAKVEAESLTAMEAVEEDTGAEESATPEEEENVVNMDQLLAAQSRFSVYDDVKAKLVASGLPEAEIAFIHDYDTSDKKAKLYLAVREGRIRVLLGSTEKLGAGTNVQDRLVAEHHLDAPWRPSDLEQREGRIIRQGNKLYERDPDGFEIEIWRYATKQTYDTRMWQLIEHKARGIEQLRRSDGTGRTTEDIAGEAASAADMKAAASGNPLILDEIKLRTDVSSLEAQESNYLRNRFELQRRIEWLKEAPKREAEQLKSLVPWIKARDATAGKEFKIEIDGKTYTDKKDIGGPMIGKLAEAIKDTKGDRIVAGKYRGVFFSFRRSAQDSVVAGVSIDDEHFQFLAEYEKSMQFSPSGFVQRIDNMLDRQIEEDTAVLRERAAKESAEIPKAEAEVAKPFERKPDLEEKRKAHLAVVQRLKSQGGAIEMDAEMKKEIADALRQRGISPRELSGRDDTAAFSRQADNIDEYKLQKRQGKVEPLFWNAHVGLGRPSLAHGLEDGARIVSYQIYDPDVREEGGLPAHIGEINAVLDKNDKFTALRNIQVKGKYRQKGIGWGETVMASLLAHNGPGAEMLVENIQHHQEDREWDALPFWLKMGTELHNYSTDPGVQINGTLTLERYLRARAARGSLPSDAEAQQTAAEGPGRDVAEGARGGEPAARRGAAALGAADEAGTAGDRRGFEGTGAGDEGAGLSIGDVRAQADAISKAWSNAPAIVVTETPSQWPFKAPSDARGAYWRGKIYLAATNSANAAEVEFTVFHEALGHYGLRGLFGKTLDPILRDLGIRNANVRRAAKAWLLANQKPDGWSDADYLLHAIEEALADLAGSGRKLSGIGKLLAAVQRWLRAKGFEGVADWLESLSNAEALSVLGGARRFVEAGRPTAERPVVVAEAFFSRGRIESRLRRPRESLFNLATRVPVQLLGIDKLTSKAYDVLLEKVGGLIPEGVKAGVVSDYGLPEAVVDRRSQMQAHMRTQLREVGGELGKLLNLTRAESRVAYAWMNNKNGDALLADLPAESQEVLRGLKERIDGLSREAVRLRQLSADTYESNRMAYLHRSYRKYELEATKQERVASARTVRILGDQYKGRGIVDAVDMSKVQNIAPEWWQRKLRTGSADKALVKQKFIRFERRENRGEGVETLEGVEQADQRGRLREVQYWPAEEAVPAKYGAWFREGEWQVRGIDKGKLLMWRDFTPEERQRMGEIDEVRFAVAKTMQQMIHDTEAGKYLEWLANHYSRDDENLPQSAKVIDAKESLFRTFAPDEWVKVPEADVPGTKVKKYGKLAGLYIPGPIWNDVRQIVNRRYAPLGDAFATALRAWKISKTALSPAVHMNNIMANVVMADWHDILARDLVKALAAMVNSNDQANKKLLDAFEDNGGTQGTYALAELQREQLRPLVEQLQREIGTAEDAGIVNAASVLQAMLAGRLREAASASAGGAVARLAGKAANVMIDLYQAEDTVFRLAAFIKARAEGKTDAEAGKAARQSFLDYQINAPWIQMMRSTAFPFISFVYRAAPMMLETYARKPWKLLKLWIVLGGLNALGYAISGGDEDKERRLLPKEKQGRVAPWVSPKLIRMPWNDKHGSPVFLDVRRFIPVGDIFDIGATHSALPWSPVALPGGPLAVAIELIANKSQFTGREITRESDTPLEIATKVFDHIYKAVAPNLPFLPGTYSYKAISDAGKGRTDPFGREQSLPAALASSVGVKLGSYPADVARRGIKFDVEQVDRDTGAEIAKLKREFAAKGITREQFDRQVQYQLAKKKKAADEARERLR